MLDVISAARLRTVHPALQSRVLLIVADFEQQVAGDTLLVIQALRTWAEQEALWLKGRDGAGNVIEAGAVVTQAQPGHSWHEFGLAVDLVPRSLVGMPNWKPESGLWVIIQQIAVRRGLVTSACWHHRDLPHVQLTGGFGVSPADGVRKLYLSSGGRLQAIWDASGIPSEVSA